MQLILLEILRLCRNNIFIVKVRLPRWKKKAVCWMIKEENILTKTPQAFCYLPMTECLWVSDADLVNNR